MKLLGIDGSPISVFASPARGVLAADGGQTIVYDDDPMPQTVPEPAALVVLLIGAVGLLARKES